MSLKLIQAPQADPVTLAEMKQHMHVDYDDEDARISNFILTATRRLDGRDGLLGRALITQDWSLWLDRFPRDAIAMPLSPLQSVTFIKYRRASDGEWQTLAPADYAVYGVASEDRAMIKPAHGKSWPATWPEPEAVEVQFRAGYGDDPEDVPEPLRTAIKMHVGHLFEHRESVVIGSGFIVQTPQGYDDLIVDYRLWSF